MFVLDNYQEGLVCKTLSITNDMFHRALQDGEKRYHVHNLYGIDFDIVYLDNNDDIEPIDSYPKYVKGPFMDKLQRKKGLESSALICLTSISLLA